MEETTYVVVKCVKLSFSCTLALGSQVVKSLGFSRKRAPSMDRMGLTGFTKPGFPLLPTSVSSFEATLVRSPLINHPWSTQVRNDPRRESFPTSVGNGRRRDIEREKFIDNQIDD
jgi:hypothetical protein